MTPLTSSSAKASLEFKFWHETHSNVAIWNNDQQICHISFLSWLKKETLPSSCLHIESNISLPQNNKDTTNNENSESTPARKTKTKTKQIKEKPMTSNLLNTNEICLTFFNALF